MDKKQRDKALYMISTAAELADMHPQSLRIYENKGLINPQRTGGNTRLYSDADIDQLHYIKSLTEEGINLAGVLRIIDLQNRLNEREESISKLEEINRKLENQYRDTSVKVHINELMKAEENPLKLLAEKGAGNETR